MKTWQELFREQWTPITGGVMIAFFNTMMFAYDSPWAVYTGVRNWGLHLLEFLGVGDVASVSPLQHTSSVMNLGFLLGAFAAALLAGQFALRIPPLREAIKGLIGGALMGIGANFARGCTIGGFYSSVASMSVSGLLMLVGLFIGVIIGLKYLLWEKRGKSGPGKSGSVIAVPKLVQAPIGLIALGVGAIYIPYSYDLADYNELGVIFALALALGIINQRSRFCVVRSLRDPFMLGDGEMTKGLITSLVVVVIGFAVIKFLEIRDPLMGVGSTVGWPAIVGGIIFGLGMTIAGGCASGSLWRTGEGQVKLMLSLFSFAIFSGGTYVVLNIVFGFSYVNRKFLPDELDGYLPSLLLLGAIFLIWYIIVSWNERTEKLVILK